ncbi:hypothetical protein [Nitrospira sp. Nam74]
MRPLIDHRTLFTRFIIGGLCLAILLVCLGIDFTVYDVLAGDSDDQNDFADPTLHVVPALPFSRALLALQDADTPDPPTWVLPMTLFRPPKVSLCIEGTTGGGNFNWKGVRACASTQGARIESQT